MIYLIIVVIYLMILLLSFIFSGTETGFLSLNKEKFRSDIVNQKPDALNIQRLVGKPDIMLGVTLCGNNLSNVAIIEIGSVITFYGYLNEEYLLTYVIITSILLFIFGEVFPKTLFRSYSNSLLYKLGWLLKIFEFTLWPFVFIVTKLSNLILFPVLHIKNKTSLSRKDFVDILSDTYEEGFLDEEELHFYDTVSSLSKIKVTEVMTPLVDLYMVNKNQELTLLMKSFKKKNYHIIPVYDGRIDNLVGYVDLIEVFNSTKRKKMVLDFLVESEYIPETNTLDKTYKIFNTHNTRMLIIVDEYGGCSGIIKENDIIERIFGFQYDIDNDTLLSKIKKTSKNCYEVDTSYDIDDFNKHLNLGIPKDGYETLGGFINSLCGSIPKEGVVITWKNIRLKVLRASKTSVDLVEIHILQGNKQQ